MKKIYTFLFSLLLAAGAFAQPNVSVTLDNYTSSEATSDDPLDLSFVITNEGSTAIPMGDSLYYAIRIGSQLYSLIDLAPMTVTYSILDAELLAGGSAGVTAPTITMDWLFDEFGGTNGLVCVRVGVGFNSMALDAANDSDYSDNEICVDYTVTAVTGIGEEDLSQISVYPNPAVDVINFNLAGNTIETINVMDVSGRVVDVINVNESIEVLDVNNYESGIYYYQLVKNGEVVKTDKFIVTK